LGERQKILFLNILLPGKIFKQFLKGFLFDPGDIGTGNPQDAGDLPLGFA
jgi:hypothetical protein